MIIRHHDITVTLPDEWWVEAGMSGFTPYAAGYRFDSTAAGDEPVSIIAVTEVAPVIRSPGVAIFNDSATATSKQRVISVLTAFRDGIALPPVECLRTDGRYPFRLIHGTHRLYCSIAAGFTHIPTVEGFDPGPPTLKV